MVCAGGTQLGFVVVMVAVRMVALVEMVESPHVAGVEVKCRHAVSYPLTGMGIWLV